MSHSELDRKLCEKIKKLFIDSDNVHLLDQEFSCIEFDEIVKKFDFLIASRYHSIVHAYKNHIPCIVLGWAEKYQTLAANFQQEQYLFDVRENLDIQMILDKIECMQSNKTVESEKIRVKLQEIQKENVFDELSLK